MKRRRFALARSTFCAVLALACASWSGARAAVPVEEETPADAGGESATTRTGPPLWLGLQQGFAWGPSAREAAADDRGVISARLRGTLDYVSHGVLVGALLEAGLGLGALPHGDFDLTHYEGFAGGRLGYRFADARFTLVAEGGVHGVGAVGAFLGGDCCSRAALPFAGGRLEWSPAPRRRVLPMVTLGVRKDFGAAAVPGLAGLDIGLSFGATFDLFGGKPAGRS